MGAIATISGAENGRVIELRTGRSQNSSGIFVLVLHLVDRGRYSFYILPY